MTDISVIIVNYNVRQLLLDCLNSLYRHIPQGLVLETIVIDNNSSDGSVEAVLSDFPQVTVIANKFNAGFSGGNNQGMSIAKGRFLFLLNPDTEVLDNALRQLFSYISGDPGCAIVAPQLLNTDHSLQVSAWKEHSAWDLVLETFFLHRLFGLLEYPPGQFAKTAEVKACSGAALLFRKTLTEQIGMLDEQLFWMEDIDFCLRARQHGKLVYLHTAQVVHHSGQSQKKNYNVAVSNQLLSKLKYYKKHFSAFYVILAAFSCFVFIVSRLLAFSILSPFRKLFRLKAKAYFYTLKRFFRYIFLNEKRIV